MRNKSDAWCRNEDEGEEISRKKAHRVMCSNSAEENKFRYKNVTDKVKEAVLKQ